MTKAFLNRYSSVGLCIAALLGLAAYGTFEGGLFPPQVVGLYIGSLLGAYLITFKMVVPYLIPIHIRAGLSGKDIYLKGTPAFERDIAECLGLGVATVFFSFLLCMYGCAKLFGAEELAAVLSASTGYILFGTFLGFADDVLELRWRDKIIFPFFFSILIIFSYRGDTAINLPGFVSNVIGLTSVDLSYFFYFYMICLSIFCVNSINIYAGISGLESGQSLIIGLTLMLENFIDVFSGHNAEDNLRSLLILGPFCAVSLALLQWNRADAKTFVGDTYCYFAGCVLAACGIVGRYPFKLLFFFLPQLFNFVISLPQLFGIVFCPRHRLPTMDLASGRLQSTFPQNLNLVNFALWVTGPLTEKQLGDVLIALQFVCNAAVIVAFRLVNFN